MDIVLLQQELLEFLILLQQLNPVQLKELCNFITNNPQDGWFLQLALVIQRATSEQLEDLVTLVSKPLEPDQQDSIRRRLQSLADECTIPMKELEDTLNLVLQLQELQSLLQSLSILQLMKLFEVMPSVPMTQQRQLLLQIQQLLAQLQPEVLINLHTQVTQAAPGNEQQTLVQLLNLPFEHFQLYQPLRVLFQLDLEELLKLQEELPKFNAVQSKQLLQLLQLTPFDVIEFRKLLNPYDGYSTDMLTEQVHQPTISQTPMEQLPPQTPQVSDKRLSLQIVEQPPEKSVYKRNLKPNPMVMVVGDQKVSGNLFVAVTLVRCDTLQDEPKFLTGNRPERVTAGRVVTFRKLKVTTTSHQQQETLFCLKFELRRYTSDEDFEILEVVHSNPVCVLSHSTQMKPVPTNAPTITEVIPGCGPPSGGTRVAVLGSNFVDSPAARIRFDTTDVMPIFHGPGTLICHTPQHQPGQVTVRVCNSTKKWSDTSATYNYDQSLESFRDPMQETLTNRQNFDGSINEAAWQGNYDTVRRLQEGGANVNNLDQRGYAPIHYACAQGNVELCGLLVEKGANLNIQDKEGGSALFWASAFGHEEVVQLLVDHGARLNVPTCNGIYPLMAAIAQGYSTSVAYMLEHGASSNVASIAGETPLHIASAIGNEDVVRELIRNGGYVNATDEDGDTPLHWAIREQMYHVIQLLLQSGANIDAVNDDNETPLLLALALGEFAVADLLIRVGASINVYDSEGDTPLHIAAQLSHPHIVQALLKKGANPNAQNCLGNTPAHAAVTSAPEFQLLQILGAAGADYTKQNVYGTSALEAAPAGLRSKMGTVTMIPSKHEFTLPARTFGRFGGVLPLPAIFTSANP